MEAPAFSQSAGDLNDCELEVVKKEFQDHYYRCSEHSYDPFVVIVKSVCNRKVDARLYVKEKSKRWEVFKKNNLAPGDTMLGFACDGTGKFKWEIRLPGDNSFTPENELNADYLRELDSLNALKFGTEKKQVNLFAKLLYGDLKKEPLINQKVILKTTDGPVMESVTDQYGDFSFKNIKTTEKLEIVLDNNPNLSKQKAVFLAEQNGTILKEIRPNSENTFKHALLPSDIHKLSVEEEEDPFLVIPNFKKSNDNNLTVSDFIYYPENEWAVLPDVAKKLDEAVKILKENPEFVLELSAYTDAKGDDLSNLKLSEKRAEEAVKYIVSKGVPANRISGKGLGETKILNRCVNGVDCSEKEHQLNRRTEFKFIKKRK